MPTTQKRQSSQASDVPRSGGTRTKVAGQTAPRRTPARSGANAGTTSAQSAKGGDNITITIPVDRIVSAAANAAKAPVTIARRVLPAKGGLLVYAGIGALAIAEIIEWPIAVTAGVSYAVLRRWGPVRSILRTPPKAPDTHQERSKA